MSSITLGNYLSTNDEGSQHQHFQKQLFSFLSNTHPSVCKTWRDSSNSYLNDLIEKTATSKLGLPKFLQDKLLSLQPATPSKKLEVITSYFQSRLLPQQLTTMHMKTKISRRELLHSQGSYDRMRSQIETNTGNWYTTLTHQRSLGRSELYATAFARSKIYDNQTNEDAHNYALTYEGRRNLGHSDYFSKGFAEFFVYDTNSVEIAISYAKTYEKQRNLGKTHYFSKAFAELATLDNTIDKYTTLIATAYDKQRQQGKLHHYSKAFSISVVYDKKTDEIARRFAKTYEQQINLGKSVKYSFFYSNLHTYKKMSSKKTTLVMTIYEKECEKGNSHLYSQTFAMSIVINKQPPKTARLYAKQHDIKEFLLKRL
jgi:hypothetical protein